MIIQLTEITDGEPLELICEIRKMSLADFHDALRGIVIIRFVKKSTGKERNLVGTRNVEIIKRVNSGSDGMSGGEYAGKDPRVIPVFDLIKKKWRSFDVRTVRDVQKREIDTIGRLSRRKKYQGEIDRRRLTNLFGLADRDSIDYVNDSFTPRGNMVLEMVGVEVERTEIKSFRELL